MPLIASLTTINNVNYQRLVDIYEVFKDRVDVCVFYLAWWIDEESAEKHTRDFEARFGFKPQKHYGWIGNWRPPDIVALSKQLKRLNELAKNLSGPAVIIMPHWLSQRIWNPITLITVADLVLINACRSSARWRLIPTETCPLAAIITTMS